VNINTCKFVVEVNIRIIFSYLMAKNVDKITGTTLSGMVYRRVKKCQVQS